MTPTPRQPTPHGPTLTARTPADLIAAVPCVLGFHPEDSLVMLTFARRGRSFHARVDLPPDPDDHEELCAVLLHSAVTNGVERVVFVAYTADAMLARAAMDALEMAFDEAEIDVMDVLRADGTRWFPMRVGLPSRLYAGVPYDASSHPFAAESVLAGRVTHRSREDLAATISPDEAAVARVQALLAEREVEVSEQQRPAEARWLLATVTARLDALMAEVLEPVAAPNGLADETVARLLVACRDDDLRGVALSLVTREDADAHVALWSDVVRRTPTAWAAAPAALLGFAAWQAGQGALAWCAVDRSREADPDGGLARLVGEVLAAAMPPDVWHGPAAGDLPVLGLDA
jgi:Domain of unknown function (DUF4192)